MDMYWNISQKVHVCMSYDNEVIISYFGYIVYAQHVLFIIYYIPTILFKLKNGN